MSVERSRRRRRDVRIAWESRGDGPPLLLIHGLGYARWGWEPVADRLAERFRVLLFDNRGIGESEVPPGPYTARGDGRGRVRRCSTRPASSARTSSGRASAGWWRRSSRSRCPARVDRLVLACTTPGGAGAFPLPQRTLALIAEAPSLAPEVALRRFVENALADDAPEELVDRIYAHRAREPARSGRLAGAGRGGGELRRPRPDRGHRRPDADPPRHRRRRRRLPQRGAPRRADPGRARATCSRAAGTSSSGRTRTASSTAVEEFLA